MTLLVIFSGFNQRAVISFIRVISKYRNIQFVIVASGPEDTIYDSIYKDKVGYERKNKSLGKESFEPIIKWVHAKYPSYDYVIVPSAEALNRALLSNAKYFNDNNVSIPLVERDIYESVSDKHSFKIICEEAGIKTPGLYNSIHKFPTVAKPKRYFSSDNKSLYPYLIYNEEQKSEFIKAETYDDYYFEEFIDGESYYLFYYVAKAGDVLSYSQKNLLQQPAGKSIIAAEPAFIHREEISKIFIHLFKKICFWGLVMVEVRFDGVDYYMIEANPRLWGPSQLFVDAGIGFFEKYLVDLGFEVRVAVETERMDKELRYFWHGGFVGSIRGNEKPTYHKGTTEEEFKKNLGLFLKNEIYKREDTMQIYLRELQ